MPRFTSTSKLHKDLNNDVGVIVLALTLLVDEDTLHLAELPTLLSDLALQVIVDVVRTDHVLQDHHCGLTEESWY